MPSPFPGMDPFLEGQEWEDFHTTLNTVIREQLIGPLEPCYIVRVERRVYVEGPGEEYEQRETYLVIRERKNMEDVTVIETLSPANKRNGDGRREYLEKRDEVISSKAHLVELDLLRGGERMPMPTPLPPGDYYAVISRRYRRPRAEVYAWTLRDALPTIPIPLRKGDDDALLDLQSAFSTVYARARYDLSVQYGAELYPPPGQSDAEWIQSRLKSRA